MPPVLSKLPVMMSDEDVIDKRYENCVIYKLVHKEDEDKYEKYVGHTIQTLNERMWEHRKGCNNKNRPNYDFKVYKYIRENGGIDMWEIVKIIDYPCKNEIEAGKKEGEYITSLNCSLNVKIAGRSREEYTELHRDYFNKLRRDDYHANKEEYNRKDRERWNDRKEQQSKYKKEKYKLNKELILAKQKERIICDNCGSEIRKGDLARHKKSKKCLEHNRN